MKFNRIIVALAVALVIVAVGVGVAFAQGALTVNITAPANDSTFEVGESINFSAEATGGVPGTISYNWTFGDGSAAYGESYPKSYGEAGEFTVQVSVADDDQNTAEDTIKVNIVDSGSTQLVISNIQVTNITETTATVTWDTNLPANSRVIYDTVSHSDISNASGPDYGYANSTATFDNSPKVTSHSVDLTGLSAQTKYYFRVISEE